jgi:hypothetical protein
MYLWRDRILKTIRALLTKPVLPMEKFKPLPFPPLADPEMRTLGYNIYGLHDRRTSVLDDQVQERKGGQGRAQQRAHARRHEAD